MKKTVIMIYDNIGGHDRQYCRTGTGQAGLYRICR